MSNNIYAHYPCTQAELYSVCEMGWISFQTHVGDFSSKKAFYTNAYAIAAMDGIHAAELLPNVYVRNEVAESLRVELAQSAAACRRCWQQLKLYLQTAYAKEFIKLKLKASGAAFYVDASNEDWEAVRSLMNDGNNFIIANTVDLEAGNNMPAAFLTVFGDTRDNFLAIHSLFLGAEGQTSIKTQEKIMANNAVYDKLLAMLKDAHFIFANDPALRKQFVFDSILELVSGSGSAGLRGLIMNGNTSGPLANVSLSLYEGTNVLVDAKYATTSDDEGGYNFGVIASGSYTLKMECVDFITKLEEVVIEVGVRSGKSFTMVQA